MKIPFFKKRKNRHTHDISYDEILFDAASQSLSESGTRTEGGQLELPLSRKNIYFLGGVFVIILGIFLVQAFKLQVVEGSAYRERSENNRLQRTVIIAKRGVIYDRSGTRLAWNELDPSGTYAFPVRAYTNKEGLGPLLGYVKYPQKDSSGFYYKTKYTGVTGVEETYNDILQGDNGTQLIEVNALGDIVSKHIVTPPTPGKNITLSVDAGLSQAMYELIATTTKQNGFVSGGGVMMDIHTGELVAFASYPSYDPEVLADGDNVLQIKQLFNDPQHPLINKIIGGLYAPGSIVKPMLAYGALVAGTMDPNKVIYSNGRLVVPNPWNPGNPAVFHDWRVQGKMTMKEGIAFSSNVYFYILGGGLHGATAEYRGVPEQEGLGIDRINKFTRLFGLGSRTGINLKGELAGVVPTPEWKEKVFGQEWFLGDTYLSSIGQFGFEVTPLQMVHAYAAVANGGTLLTPNVILGKQGEKKKIPIDHDALTFIKEAMRLVVTHPRGTAKDLDRDDVQIAAKSGTAERGKNNAYVNSWIVGFFPYTDPQYAFTLFMAHGPRTNRVGASWVMGQVFDWMAQHRPGYLSTSTDQEIVGDT